MSNKDWQLIDPIDAVTFDCDGTLSAVEGIVRLAEHNNVADRVRDLTARAMSESGINSELYQERIELVRPTRKQLIDLGSEYYNERSSDVCELVGVLHELKKPVFVISAGLNPSVKLFASLLKIPLNHVYAVDVMFDDDGSYRDYDRKALPSKSKGKLDIIKQLQRRYPRIMHVGDGMNDYEVALDVARFVGYGGAYYRQHFADICSFYVKSQSLMPILPLAITEEEHQLISTRSKEYYEYGLSLFAENVLLNSL